MPATSDNVWIGDLPMGMDKGSLATLFEAYGTVVECRMLPGKDENTKPCALLRFGGVEMAAWVVENLNGNIPEGLAEPVIVRFANTPKGKGDGKGDAGGSWGPYGGGAAKGGAAKGGGFQAPAASDNVWIGDLPVGTDKNDLAPIFEAYGQIVESRMLPGRDASAKPCAMVRFASLDMATWVVENLNGNIPQGLEGPIIARYANDKKGAQKGGASGGWQQPGAAAAQSWGGGKGGWQQPAAAAQPWGGGKAAAKGGKGGKAAAPGSFQALFQSVKGGGILGGGNVPDECQCFIKNLPPDTTDGDLYKLFAPFGAIPPTGVKAMLNPDGSCKGIGFVDFSDPTAATTAVMALDGHTCPDGSCINVSTKKPSTGAKAKGKGDKGKGKHQDQGAADAELEWPPN